MLAFVWLLISLATKAQNSQSYPIPGHPFCVFTYALLSECVRNNFKDFTGSRKKAHWKV